MDPDRSLPGSCHRVGSGKTVVQEWTGVEWIIVDDSDAQGCPCRPLDAQERPGEYVGERVVTPGE